MQSKPIIQSNK